MRILMLLLSLYVLSPQGCQDDADEYQEMVLEDEKGYVAEDIKIRKAIADWNDFLKQANKNVMSAEMQISRAVDRLDNPNTIHKGKLKSKIIKADTQLERLSQKLLGADKFNIVDIKDSDASIQKMEDFKNDFTALYNKLLETLKELKSKEYTKATESN